MFAVARYAGSEWWKKMRLISDRTNNNWLFGFHWTGVGKHFFNGWVKDSGLSSNTDFHLLAASINSSDTATTWLDFVENTQNPNGAHNSVNYYMPKQLQFGGWQSRSEYSTGEIAEFVAFNQVLSDTERKKVEGYLAHKWSLDISLPSGHEFQNDPPAAWSPTNENTLQAWFDANDSASIVSGFVKEWRDSANGNIFTQLNMSERPKYIEDGINGLPAVLFDGIEDFLEIETRFGLSKNPDLMVFAVTTPGISGIDLSQPLDSVSSFTGSSPSTQGAEKAIDNDPDTKYLNNDVNNSGLIVTTQHGGMVNGLSFTSGNDMPGRDPASYILEGSNDNGVTFSTISEGTVPAFTDRGQRKQIFIENNSVYSTFRITFPSVVDYNSSNEMQIAEIELLGIPESDEWLSVNRIFQLGSKNRKRILAGSPVSWRFNDGLINFQEPDSAETNLQTWLRSAGTDYNSSRFFLNGMEQNQSEVDNSEGFPNDSGVSLYIGAGFDDSGGILPYSGKIGELIVVNGTSDDIRHKIEGYLAHKWGLASQLDNNHPYKSGFNATYTPPVPLSALDDQSGNGNHATQNDPDRQPGYLENGQNSLPIIQLDGNSDVLNFETSLSSIRSLFLVAERKPGNRGFILGHDTGYAFQSGTTSMWNKSWTDPNLMNGTIRENGNWRDGLIQDYAAGSMTITSIVTDGLVRGSNFSRDRNNETYWKGTFAELLVYNEPLPANIVRLVEGYLAHKWGLENSLTLSHPYRYNDPVASEPTANISVYWGENDGGTDPELWENKAEIGSVSVGLRKLTSSEINIKTIPEPNDRGTSYPATKLLDGQLPRDGWRSTWTAWYGVNPQLTFTFNREWPMSKIRLYYQPFVRDDELKQIDAYIADDEMNFFHHKTVLDMFGPLERGKFIEFSLEGVSTQGVRLVPQFQGWGHQWGEVEFWVYDDGKYESSITSLAEGKTYYYRTFASNNGGGAWSEESQTFVAEDQVTYSSGKLMINTTLGTQAHSNGDTRYGEVTIQNYYDELGSVYPYKVCTFNFDKLSLVGSLEVVVTGDASLNIQVSGDTTISVPFSLNGTNGGTIKPGKPGPGGYFGGEVNERGLGPGGGLSGTNPGGAGHGGAGARSTLSSGMPYGDGQISSLIGGSGGGGYLIDAAGGSGAGALSINSGGSLKIDTSLHAVGGSGASGSGGGSGGAIKLSADNLILSENSLLDVSGGGSGGSGGRIFLRGKESFQNHGKDNLIAKGGEGSIVGTDGSIRFDQPIIEADLNYFSGSLLIDTDNGTATHSDGDIHYGLVEDKAYRHGDGTLWSYSVCKFVFGEINLGGSLVIQLSGKNALLLETTSGNFILGTNLHADGGSPDINRQIGGLGILGGFRGAAPGKEAGNGPGSTPATSDFGHGAAYGGHGSGGAVPYGSPEILDLIGGSSGGSSQDDGSGAGGGALHLRSAGHLQIEANVYLTANGGNGIRSSASGSGGAIKLEAQTITNHGFVEAKAGQGIKIEGSNQTRGSGGGRVAFHALDKVTVGKVDVSGEWLSSQGSLYVGGNHFASSLDLNEGTLTFDTKTGYFSVEGGAHGTGVITNTSFTDNENQLWNIPICTFTFGSFRIGPEVDVILRGDKPLVIQTFAGGNIHIGSDFILNGSDASDTTGYGGIGILNPWHGKSSEALVGEGPGAPPSENGKGIGANFNYNKNGKLLLPGSSGSSGSLFQGSGSGGGAVLFQADGDITISKGTLISATGGNGRTNQGLQFAGGGGSGGAIQLVGANIYNFGMLDVTGGNQGAGSGQVLFASNGIIEKGETELGNGTIIEIRPPQIEVEGTTYLSYRKANQQIIRPVVLTRTENLTGYWPMDDISGFLLYDYSGENHANLTGGFKRVQGKIDGAIEFDGKSGFARTGATAKILELMQRIEEPLPFGLAQPRAGI